MILVAIGANLPSPEGMFPLATCRMAVEALRDLPGLRLHAVSRWYETVPVPPSDQPPYVNGVARLEPVDTLPDPAALLARLQAIEARCGRRRGVPNAARTLDLDIVAMGDLVRAAPDPILPHPRAHQRGFVLCPLADVAPEWVHPGLGQTVQALLSALPPDGIKPISRPIAIP
ncbi:MAG TPA: 2-amino-4-hydroxy-6-hydroxymethyldihydropteridine diphosphokinase [Acetobacteraceae bacterium]